MARPVPILNADGLFLRPWSDSDAAAVLDLASEEASRRWSPSMRLVRTEADARDWIERRRSADRVDWAVCDAASGPLIGRVGLMRIEDSQRSAEVGYGVAAPFRRTGVARRAVAAALGHAFQTMGLVRVSLRHAVDNRASCLLATAAGFAFEGLERCALDHGDGILHDVHRHARLVTDASAPPITPRRLSASRWQLRPPTAADAEAALALLQDEEVAQWNAAPAVVDLEQARTWCARGADWAAGDHATFSIVDAADRLVGNVSLHRIDREQSVAAIGYRIAAHARNRGAASAGVLAVSAWAFESLRLARIELIHAVANPSSCKVADNAGYLLEGLLRQATRYGDGRRYDEHMHARLATDPLPRARA